MINRSQTGVGARTGQLAAGRWQLLRGEWIPDFLAGIGVAFCVAVRRARLHRACPGGMAGGRIPVPEQLLGGKKYLLLGPGIGLGGEQADRSWGEISAAEAGSKRGKGAA